MSYSGVGLVGQQSYYWRHDAIGDLPGQDGGGCGLGDYDFGEEVEQIVEPAGSNEIVDEVANSIGPDMYFLEAIEGVVCVGVDMIEGCISIFE